MNQELVNYIALQLKNGASRELIKSTLLGSGWVETDIEAALKAAGSEAPADMPPNGAAAKSDSAVSKFFSSSSAAKPAGGTAPKFDPAPSAMELAEKLHRRKELVSWIIYGVLGLVIIVLVGALLNLLNSTAGNSQDKLLQAQKQGDILNGQVAALTKTKNDLASQVTALASDNADLANQLSVFATPPGAAAGDKSITLTGLLQINGGQYFLLSGKNVVFVIKNYKDPKVVTTLSSFAGKTVQVSGTYTPGVRDITVTTVNGAAVGTTAPAVPPAGNAGNQVP